jgi:glycosyltransferase involved in cell wall biosynthesis
MVGRNEADRFLPEVLAAVIQIADEVVFTDDCSTDDTPFMAVRAGAHVMKLDQPLFVEDEGALRTHAWAHLCEYAKPGDWILAIDCDEIFYGAHKLREGMQQANYDVLGVTFYHMWNETQYRTDKLWAPVTSSRLFRFFEGGEFRNRKLACGSEPTYVQELIRRGKFLPNTPFRMKHLGYIRDEDKIAKYQRYMELDGGAYHNRAHLESILDPSPTLVDWEDDA